MVVSRTLQAGSCVACRLSLLRTFTSLPLATLRVQQSSNPRLSSRRSNQQVRYSSHDVDTPPTGADVKPASVDVEQTQAGIESLEDAEVSQFKPVEPIPWYLQVEEPQTQIRPLSERQQIPDLPESPPPLLQPLLQQISVDLGLDDLTLLDLRKLDPPPALGANLLMIIGTTRSERHLHVSADRLCRWLRTNYHLRPDADGLIGRNELKLRLKRKAKRARLMGSANDDSYDDGVRTGWVCVDVGIVEGAEGAEPTQQEDFVGFGRRTDGVRIVVQMLTEEKRAEVNLEKLWGDVLKRGGKMDINEEFGEARLGVAEFARRDTAAPKLKVSSSRWQDSKSPILSQARRFHSSARHTSDQFQRTLESVTEFDVYHKHGVDVLQGIQESIQRHLATAEFQKAKDLLLDCRSEQPLLKNEEWRRFFLHNLRVYVEGLPVEQAIQALGEGADDQTSTPFLKTFYETVTRFPDQSQTEGRIWLHCWAHALQHPGYDSSALYRLLKEIQLTGVRISTTSYLDVIERLLHRQEQYKHFGPDPQAIHRITKIIETMSDQGHDILSQDVLVRLQQAVAPGLEEDISSNRIYTDDADTFNLPSYPMTPLQKRIHLLIMHLKIPLINESSRLTLMELYAHQRNWAEFWEIWRLAPRHGKARSAEFYASMLVLVAATHHIKGVQTVLRHWIPEMAKETPKVTMKGNVGVAANYCLQVADPNVEEDYANDPNSPAEWVKLRRQIERDGGLQEEK